MNVCFFQRNRQFYHCDSLNSQGPYAKSSLFSYLISNRFLVTAAVRVTAEMVRYKGLHSRKFRKFRFEVKWKGPAVSVRSDRNIWDHLSWRWFTLTERTGRAEIYRSILTNCSVAFLQFSSFSQMWGTGKGNGKWLARFKRKMSFHFSLQRYVPVNPTGRTSKMKTLTSTNLIPRVSLSRPWPSLAHELRPRTYNSRLGGRGGERDRPWERGCFSASSFLSLAIPNLRMIIVSVIFAVTATLGE